MPDQNTDVQVVTNLYSHYLQESIRLTEENVRLRVRIAELEAEKGAEGDSNLDLD
ncbi:hypothetical protein [Brevibacterium album]|uniref:hypothetical protein n=1 Tax=Brevibacterium album TaxID=417948 RepID=UPI0003F80574|nr:hypothetical protein [Brevibacterium album]